MLVTNFKELASGNYNLEMEETNKYYQEIQEIAESYSKIKDKLSEQDNSKNN